MTLPLSGVTVVESGEGISAAYCSLALGVLGADVIKVEPPAGDQARRVGPFPGDVPHLERSALFLSLNRNKRSLVLDLDTPTGQELFRSVVQRAQILVENHPPGYLDERGLGYESLAAVAPSLVHTSITPFGQDGPYSRWAASEISLFALGGMMNLVGDAGREPLKFGGSPAMYMAGVYAKAATMIAFHQAEATGEGEHVDVAILEGLAASHFQDLMDYEYRGQVRSRAEARMPIPTLDGFISFTVQAHQYADFRRLILGDAAGETSSVGGDVVARDRNRAEGEMDAEILTWAVQQTKYEAYRRAQEAHVPAAYLADIGDLMQSPQYEARQFFVEIDHPEVGPLRYPGFPARLPGVRWEHRRAPMLGEHTDEILLGLTDLTAEEIAEVRAAGAAV